MDASRLRSVPLFEGLSDHDLERLALLSEVTELTAGETLFDEGDLADRAYVIEEGEIEIIKWTGTRPTLLIVRTPHDVIGEMALLHESRRTASARARGPARLLAIPRDAIDELLTTSPEALRALFEVLLHRWMATQDAVRHSARMAQLGTLTAGLAHEVNNPAAAARRAARSLRDAVTQLIEAERSLVADVPATERARREHRLAEITPAFPPLSPLDRSDREDELAEALRVLGAPDPLALASELSELAGIDEIVDDEAALPLLAVAARRRAVDRLISELVMALDRVTGVVEALKSHAQLDRGDVVDTDIAAGIQDTLTILRSTLSGLRVDIDLPSDLPTVEAYRGELAQVWTNLIDNAARAASQQEAGAVSIRARFDPEHVVVEIEDNGPGIPEEVRDRIFDAFFTTKPPGEGTGLGLKISNDIVVDRHAGSIDFETEPGRTVFRVTLPRRGGPGQVT